MYTDREVKQRHTHNTTMLPWLCLNAQLQLCALLFWLFWFKFKHSIIRAICTACCPAGTQFPGVRLEY